MRSISVVLKMLLFIAVCMLAYEGVTQFQTQSYWEMFVNGIFMLIGLYVLFLYEKRKLMLNQDLIKILFVFFMGLLYRSLTQPSLFESLIAMIMLGGFATYLLIHRRHKHMIYFNKKQIRRAIK